jgi:hypothetical protein
MAEVTVPKELFEAILERIERFQCLEFRDAKWTIRDKV